LVRKGSYQKCSPAIQSTKNMTYDGGPSAAPHFRRGRVEHLGERDRWCGATESAYAM
jgi:hypothetical protein